MVTRNMHCYYITHIDWSFSQNPQKSQFHPFRVKNGKICEHSSKLYFFKEIQGKNFPEMSFLKIVNFGEKYRKNVIFDFFLEKWIKNVQKIFLD